MITGELKNIVDTMNGKILGGYSKQQAEQGGGMAHNKTLAAQLYSEFKEFFPENAVEYFVSYYGISPF